MSADPHTHVDVMQRYMRALGNADYPAIVALFAPHGRVLSPFLGDMPVALFFDRLGAASQRNVITPIDTFTSAGGADRSVAFFRYDWTVTDGTLITFEVMDLFDFVPGTAQVERLTLIYDTHPIRSSAGNKYET